MSSKPAHKRFKLDPPHGPTTLYWVSVGPAPGDSRREQITARREWFWGSADRRQEVPDEQ